MITFYLLGVGWGHGGNDQTIDVPNLENKILLVGEIPFTLFA